LIKILLISFCFCHKVIELSQAQNAIPFDVPNVEPGHHGEEDPHLM
jgi:hypothetical protein